jgi:hypothetical protein
MPNALRNRRILQGDSFSSPLQYLVKQWLDSQRQVYSDGAADFSSANKEYLTVASDATFQAGGGDFEFGLWIKPTIYGDILDKWGAAAGRDYGLYIAANHHLTFDVTTDGTNAIVADAGAVNSLYNTWIFVVCRINNTTKKFGVSYNNGAFTETDFTGTINNGTFQVEFGNARFQSNFNGQMDSVYFSKRLSTAGELTAMYNGGAGRIKEDLTASNGLGTFFSNLTHWYSMNEESGTRFDSIGTAHLTAAANKLIQPAVYGSELIQNTGFETGAGNPVFGSWPQSIGDGAIAVEGTLVHSGSQAAKLTSGPTANTFINQYFTVTPGSTYQFTFWTRGDGTNTGRYQIYDGTHGASIIVATSTGISGTAYQLVTGTFTAPVGTT